MKLLKTLLLLLLIVAPVLFATAQNLDSLFNSTTYGKDARVGKYAKIRGINMYYESYGKGEPLLIIHGNGGSINNFIYQIPFFSKNYRVILADSRSQGKSTDTGDSLSYEMMADDLSALLDTLHLDSCYVIGWSDGGINGLLLAMRHPEKVKKLAVTGANLWPDSTAVDPFIYKWAIGYNDTLQKMKATPKVVTARKLARLLSHEPHIPAERLSTIHCPTLVIGGDHDVIRIRHTLLVAESIPQSYLWILPASGHSTPVFYKDQFNAVVQDFFKKPYRKIEGYDRFN